MAVDSRMGLKHVILQRLQSSSKISVTSTIQKSHTDFSIKTILGDAVTDNRKFESETNENVNILDLSKPTKEVPANFYSSNSQNSYQPPVKRSTAGSDHIIKPKVLKLWENNCVAGSDCSACAMYFKNLNLNFHFTGQLSSNQVWTVAQNSNGLRIPIAGQYLDQFRFSTTAMMTAAVSRNYKGPPTVIKDDEMSYKCQTCDKVFSCAYTLESHEKTHKSPRYECSDCGKGFSQLRNYKYHLSVHRGTKEFAAECPECGKTFNDKGYLSSHMKIHRNKKEYECPYCPKSFNQRVAFNMHVRIHTGVKPHKCTECGKRFSRKMLLKQHMRTHSGEKPYQCSVCGKSFADRSNMTLHHRLHSGIKPFACPICPKAFTKKHHLKTHLNYHTGCKPYVCPHPNCNQAFTQSSNMRTHAKKCQFKPVQQYF